MPWRNGPRSTTGTTDVGGPGRGRRPSVPQASPVGDAERLEVRLLAAGGAAAVEAGAVPGGERRAVDGDGPARAWRRRRLASPAICSDDAHAVLRRAFGAPAREERAVGRGGGRRPAAPQVCVVSSKRSTSSSRPAGPAAAVPRKRASQRSMVPARVAKSRVHCAVTGSGSGEGAGPRSAVRGLRRRGPAPQVAAAAARQRQLRDAWDSSWCFLRCLRGQLSGSRGESSTRSDTPVSIRPRPLRRFLVPRSPVMYTRRFGAREPIRQRLGAWPTEYAARPASGAVRRRWRRSGPARRPPGRPW